MTFAGNNFDSFLYALLTFFCIVVPLRLFLQILARTLRTFASHTRTKIDDFLANMFAHMIQDFYLFSFLILGAYAGARFLILPAPLPRVLFVLAILALATEAVRVVQHTLLFLIRKFWLKEKGETAQLEMLTSIVLKTLLWSVGILLVLSNIGINVSSLIASLGIGGIAVALAAQSILGDIFSAFAIYTDKPFAVGDFIVIGDHKGIVKYIGLKTTRIEALQGEEIIIPNNELTSTRVRNFKHMNKRRVEFQVGVEYGTPIEKLKKIPGLIKTLVEQTTVAEFDRAHFKEFADSSLVFEVIFFVKSGAYVEYMDARQDINFAIVEAFSQEGISMAFPTRTVHLVR
jgi:small-conductance mechanosensitive channel